MVERAQVRSVESVEAFRTALVVYLARARVVLEEVSADIQRTRLWMESEQQGHWARELRRRTTRLEEAEAALFSARLSTFREASAAEQFAVHKARRAVEEAETKKAVIRRWIQGIGEAAEPMRRQVDSLDSVLSHEMVQAVAWLSGVVRSLDAYLEVRAEGQREPGLPAGETTPADLDENRSSVPPEDEKGGGSSPIPENQRPGVES